MFKLSKIRKNKRERRQAEEKIVGEMLMDAITTQKFKLARIMITGGVNVNISVSGLTPLMIACLIPLKNDNKDKRHLIELLLECGASLNARDNFGGTALHYVHMCCCARTI
jgi:ankyrin repeat protein